MFGESARPCTFGLMELGKSSEEKLEPLTNHLRNAFSMTFYGVRIDWTQNWTVSIKSLDRTSRNFQNGIMMAPALVKPGMTFHASEQIANMFESVSSEQQTSFSSLFSSRIQFWLLFEASENFSWSIPVWPTHSRSMWSAWFWQKSSCNKSQILLQ